jgi:hypothetical protein
MKAAFVKWAIIAATLLLTACIPPSEPPPRRPAGPNVATAASPGTTACLADLRSEKVTYSLLPDRTFGGGCSMIGTVRLQDFGMPVSNLGPMTCPLARAFTRWTRDAVQPAARAYFNARVVRMESFGTYDCRPVNSRPGARLSEHGRANAVDIGAFVLDDGRRISVVQGWNGPDEDVRRFLRAVHQSGCRRFNIGLGPDANSAHFNHLHFDMGAGPYCR